MTSKQSEFKGHQVLTLYEGEDENTYNKISFGKKKAQLILEHTEDIKAFVEENEQD